MARKTRLSLLEIKHLNLLASVSNLLGLGSYLQALEEGNLIIGQPRRQKFIDPATAAANAVLTTTTVGTTTTTGFTNPKYPRVLSVTGNSGSNETVTISGTNVNDKPIVDVFTLSGTVKQVGTMAFKTVTKVVATGTTHTFTVGIEATIGLDRCMEGDAVNLLMVDGVYETTRPTVVADALLVEKNYFTPNTAPNASRDYVIYYYPVVSAKQAHG